MWMIAANFRQTDSQPKSTGLVWGLAATRRSVYIHQMNWVNSHKDFGHDESTINIVMATIIIITYGDNVAGPAFTGRAAKSNQPISPACQAHSSKPTAAALLSWSHAGTDVRTDGRTPDRCIDPARRTMRAVPTMQYWRVRRVLRLRGGDRWSPRTWPRAEVRHRHRGRVARPVLVRVRTQPTTASRPTNNDNHQFNGSQSKRTRLNRYQEKHSLTQWRIQKTVLGSEGGVRAVPPAGMHGAEAPTECLGAESPTYPTKVAARNIFL